MRAEASAMEPRLKAVCSVLAPYEWRALTPEMLARRVLGTVDQLAVLEIIGAVEGSLGELAGVDPVDRADDRIEPLVAAMSVIRWRDVQLSRLIQILLDALDQWWLRRDAVDRVLARLLDEPR
jgi:hypothetical protein